LNGEEDGGFCPIPMHDTLNETVHWNKRMWLEDNCHTYDRENFEAQLDCGIGLNYDILKNAANWYLKTMYWPYIQTESNEKCIMSFLPQSPQNFMSDSALSLVGALGISLLTLYIII
jgi:hypothetical protein